MIRSSRAKRIPPGRTIQIVVNGERRFRDQHKAAGAAGALRSRRRRRLTKRINRENDKNAARKNRDGRHAPAAPPRGIAESELIQRLQSGIAVSGAAQSPVRAKISGAQEKCARTEKCACTARENGKATRA